MIGRHQLPVASPLSLYGLLRATGGLLTASEHSHAAVTDALRQRYRAASVALTDSGTSALVLALRLAVGAGGTVAYPAYSCVDLIAAARHAGVKIRLYDVDPHTLSADLDSVRRVMREGVDAIVVAHLFGFPADVPAVRALATEAGVPIVEDAAQSAGATLHGTPAGTLGDLSVLSFGRGKGTTAGHGGALITAHPAWTASVDALRATLPPPGRGASAAVGAAASWTLGRPSVYGIPASIPALHLGETVYHDAHEPAALSYAGAALLRTTLASVDTDVAARRRTAHTLAAAAQQSPRGRSYAAIPGGVPGYLRFPLLSTAGTPPDATLGIVRSYPRPLSEEPEAQALLHPSTDTFPGAHTLAATVLTLPTHHMVTASDVQALGAWLRTA